MSGVRTDHYCAMSFMSLLSIAEATDLEPHEVFRDWRLSTGQSARAVSLACGLSPSYVSKLESGGVRPPVDTFMKLVRQIELGEPEILFLLGLYAS